MKILNFFIKISIEMLRPTQIKENYWIISFLTSVPDLVWIFTR
jgi:hypothetical protein